MNETSGWEQFELTGSVEDYLSYLAKNELEEKTVLPDENDHGSESVCNNSLG